MSSLLKYQRHDGTGATALWFAANGWVPNNPNLPVLVYANAISDAGGDRAVACERLFGRNGWPPQWRNGIYDYHHYHSTAHEVLGVAAGRADVLIGGPNGKRMVLATGDCIVLPAGTGHCLIEASADLLVVGAYPPNQDWDLRRDALSDAEMTAMLRLPIPASDPVSGASGALQALWSQVI
jgi:uncharacterized protein YjlB